MVGFGDESTDRAVTESIAVAILVVSTVLVTASVGVSVVLMDDGDDMPEAEFSFRYYSGNAMLVVEHDTGDPIDAGNIRFSNQGTTQTWAEIDQSRNETDPVDRGSAIQLSPNNAWNEPISTGDTVEVFYDPGDGNQTLLSAWDGA